MSTDKKFTMSQAEQTEEMLGVIALQGDALAKIANVLQSNPLMIGAPQAIDAAKLADHARNRTLARLGAVGLFKATVDGVGRVGPPPRFIERIQNWVNRGSRLEEATF